MYLSSSFSKTAKRSFTLQSKPSIILNVIRLCRGDKPRYKLRRKDNKLLFLSPKGISYSFILDYDFEGELALNQLQSKNTVVDAVSTNSQGIVLNILPNSPYRFANSSLFELTHTSPAALCITDLHGNSDYYYWKPCSGRNKRKLVDLADPSFTLATFTPHSIMSFILGTGHIVFNLKVSHRFTLAFIYLLGHSLMLEYEDSQLASNKNLFKKYAKLSQSPYQTIRKASDSPDLSKPALSILSNRLFEATEMTLVY